MCSPSAPTQISPCLPSDTVASVPIDVPSCHSSSVRSPPSVDAKLNPPNAMPSLAMPKSSLVVEPQSPAAFSLIVTSTSPAIVAPAISVSAKAAVLTVVARSTASKRFIIIFLSRKKNN